MKIVHPGDLKPNEQCGFPCWHAKFCQHFGTIRIFVTLMCAVIAVQGTYLGYTVGVLTTLERRFELSSSHAGLLLAMYDIGNTVTTVFVGYCGARRHKPRWTAVGVLLSSIAMFGLCLPAAVFGATTEEERHHQAHSDYVNDAKCDYSRAIQPTSSPDHLTSLCVKHSHNSAYAILMLSQLLAGVAAAPFNTLAYVYIDENVQHKNSPFYLGLLTSMYAFGPALGFALSALCNFIYANPGIEPPHDLAPGSPNWVGAWWLGFLLCALLYLLCAVPLAMFPKRLPRPRINRRSVRASNPDAAAELNMIRTSSQETQMSSFDVVVCMQSLWDIAKDMPREIWRLMKNAVFVSMMFGWIFGSYLIGGYGTYLAKYIETQFFQTPSLADIYAGVISIGAVAVSTAVGGYIMSRYNMTPQTSILCLLVSWSIILGTYLIGLAPGCAHPELEGQQIAHLKWNFTNSCNFDCRCAQVLEFDPVCLNDKTYFSPCHAGCTNYDDSWKKWNECKCAIDPDNDVSLGFCHANCWQLPIYVVVMFIGLFGGNLFFMTTMMVVLRAVQAEQRSLALSFASCATNVLSFIPAPIIFGGIIDASCKAWHSLCPHELGNCIVYDNWQFRLNYHVGNAGFQFAAVISVVITYWLSRTFEFPQDEEFDMNETDNSSTVQDGVEMRAMRNEDF